MKTSLSFMSPIRYTIAYVFITSGLMKFMSEELANHFIRLGLPSPVYFMYVVAILEVVCGVLLLINKKVKLASIPLIAIMIGAILLTKVPVLHTGFEQFAFQARLDIVMLVLLCILFNGSKKQK